MGLDMSIYRVTAPEGISEGDRIDCETAKKYEHTEFRRPDDKDLSETVKRIGVRCTIQHRDIRYDDIIRDMLIKLGVKEKKAKLFSENFKCGMVCSNKDAGIRAYRNTSNYLKMALFRYKADGKEANYVSAELENTGTHSVEAVLTHKDRIEVLIHHLKGFDVEYTGKYSFTEWKDVIAFDLKELAYQREGLNERGWELLPDPDKEPALSDDKERVRLMTEEGGLSKEFIEKWEDGQTIFNGWF